MPAEKTVWVSDKTHEKLTKWSDHHQVTHGVLIQAWEDAWREMSREERRRFLDAGKAPDKGKR